MEYFQYVAACLGMIAIFMLNFYPKYIKKALLIAVVCGVCWIVHAINVGEYALAVSQIAYTIFNCIGYYKWSHIQIEEV